jgi:iron complex outermembrane receptor protein
VDANAIVQDSELTDNGNALPYTPHVKLALTLRHTLASSGTRLETTLRYCGRQYSEAENRDAQRLNDYATVDLKGVQPFALNGIQVEGFIDVTNLFDKRFAVHYGYPDDGLRVLAGVNVTF